MELEITFGRGKQSRMEEQDRVSRTSSMVTVSSTTTYRVDKKLQTFGKRARSLKRDPNCAVVMRGWLYKRDSTGLKLWKRRWFVLSNFCLFYYKDSREDCVLGSLPLPSYKVFLCSPRECKNRKYAFKVVHQGMRSYLLSAETQEDMLGWVRALSQSACMEANDIMNRRCSSYQDFTQMRGSTESVTPTHPDYGTTHSYMYRTQNEPSHLMGVTPDQRGRAEHSTESRARSVSLDRAAEGHLMYPFLTKPSYCTPPRGHYEPFPYSPGDVDLRHQECTLIAPPTAAHLSPASKRWISQATRSDQLPPLPSSRITHNPTGLVHHGSAPVCVFTPVSGERETLTALQADIDVVLTRLCGCDKLLQSLSLKLDLLLQDKERAQFELDMTHLQLDEWQLDDLEASQKAFLQEDLITIRARMCDVTLEVEKVWLDYERMESELCVFRSHLQHICHFGLPQERCLAQKQIWMMDDILSGLKPNRSRFKALLGLQTPSPFPALVHNSIQPVEDLNHAGEESEPPARPPLPAELQSTNQSTEMKPDQIRRFDPKRSSNKKSHKENSDDKLRPLAQARSSPVCVMRVMRAELPLALTAQRVCVEEPNPEKQDPDKVPSLNTAGSDKRETKVKRSERFREKVLQRRSDCVHPLKLIQAEISQSEPRIHGNHGLNPRSVRGKVRRDTAEVATSENDIEPAPTNHVSTITISTAAQETNQRAEWFLSTSQWQDFIPLNIQEEDLTPTNQDAESAYQPLSGDAIQSITDDGSIAPPSTNGDENPEEVRETGSDVTMSTKPSPPLYTCLMKNSNQSSGFLKPRLTVESTSL